MFCYNSPADYHPSGTSQRQTMEVVVKFQQFVRLYTNEQLIYIEIKLFNSKFGYLLFFVIIFLNFVFMMCEKIEELLNSSIDLVSQLFDAIRVEKVDISSWRHLFSVQKQKTNIRVLLLLCL